MSDKAEHNKLYTYSTSSFQKLREELHRAVDLRLDLFLQNSKMIELLPDNQKILWLKSVEYLFVFYELLIKHKYIDFDSNFTSFEAHFMGNEEIQGKIKFLRPTNQLPYLFDRLIDLDFFEKPDFLHVGLSQHFLDHKGNPVTNNLLRSSLDKGLGKQAEKFIEENIIQPLLKHKPKG